MLSAAVRAKRYSASTQTDPPLPPGPPQRGIAILGVCGRTPVGVELARPPAAHPPARRPQACVWLQHRLCVSITQIYKAATQPLSVLHRYISLQRSLSVCYTNIQGSSTASVSITQIYRLPTQPVCLWNKNMRL